MAILNAVYIYDHTQKNHVCPPDVFYCGVVPRQCHKALNVWGCPLFVFDPKLQQGQKLPRWEAHSKKGMIVGFS